ncbi:MAG: DUF2267 domain-containing protein [Phycisphaeraceae bacterium]
MTISYSHVSVFDQTLQKTHAWLDSLTHQAHLENHSQAYSALRAVLHALRDRLTVEEATDLGAQLPMLVRGIYYEGWNPSKTPHKQERHLQPFLDDISREMRNASLTIDPVHAARSVFGLLQDKVSAGEIRDIKQMLPQEIRELWPEQREAA